MPQSVCQITETANVMFYGSDKVSFAFVGVVELLLFVTCSNRTPPFLHPDHLQMLRRTTFRTDAERSIYVHTSYIHTCLPVVQEWKRSRLSTLSESLGISLANVSDLDTEPLKQDN